MQNRKKRILVSPLNWGLGHATRCESIIRFIRDEIDWAEVVLAADGAAYTWLRTAFPDLKIILLPGVRIKYPSSGKMSLKMAFQVPSIISGIRKEHRQLKSIIQEHNIDLVISDNRYGLWSKAIPSVFITHQLNIIAPKGFGVLGRLINYKNQRFIKRFNQCWIPDYNKSDNLSGKLSESKNPLNNIVFTEPLSRFVKYSESDIRDESSLKSDLLIILSGPEPQRTIFENILLKQIDFEKYQTIVLRGKPGAESVPKTISEVQTFNHLPDIELFNAIKKSDIIISRPGYSTIMDLFYTGGKAIFVPTPGQTEQEYLGNRLMKQRIAPSFDQDGFDIKNALKAVKEYNGFTSQHFDGKKRFGQLIKNLLEENTKEILKT